MISRIVTLVVISGGMALSASGTSDTKEDIIAEGVKYIKMLGKELKGNVVSKMKEDPSALTAVEFCSEKAGDIEQKVFTKFPEHIKVRRTALKYRNPNNKPDTTDIKVMEKMLMDIKTGTVNKKPVLIDVDGTKRVYVAITIEKACTKCHGDAGKMNPEVLKAIKTKYPTDKAMGFKMGDFRGAMVAEISPKK